MNATDDGRGLAYFTFRSVRSSNFIRHRTVDKSLFDNVPPHEIRKEDAQCVNIRPKDGKWLESLRQLFGDSEPDTAEAIAKMLFMNTGGILVLMGIVLS